MNKKTIITTTILIETSPQALPLGAACIASSINNDNRTKDFFHAEVRALSKESPQYVSAINKQNQNPGTFIADYLLADEDVFAVCFSVFVWNRKELEAAAREIRNRNPEIILIGGGPEVTAGPETFTCFDYKVTGPGEEKVPAILYSILKNKSPEIAARVPAPEGSTELPGPYLDGTLDPNKYGGVLWELARGCPFKCSYCYESKGEQKISYFPMEKIKKELELFAQKKIPQIFVLDPTYNAGKKRALEILNLISEKTPDTFYYFEARAEFIDRELARAFTKIPCALQFGLQSADESVLKLVHRTFNKKQFVKNIGILNEEGVIFGFDLIYGLPGDTFHGFKQSIDFALSLYPNNLETFCLSVLPGTVLFDEAKSLNLNFQKEAPYHIINTDKYSKEDIAKSAELSAACNLFYNDGRAVPWFNSLCYFFHKKPHALLEDFSVWYKHTRGLSLTSGEQNFTEETDDKKFNRIQKLQLDFFNTKCNEKNQKKAYSAIESIILINGAISEISACGKNQTVKLNYHPDDLLSEYAQDIAFFTQNARPYRCTVTIDKKGWHFQ